MKLQPLNSGVSVTGGRDCSGGPVYRQHKPKQNLHKTLLPVQLLPYGREGLTSQMFMGERRKGIKRR